MLVLILVAVQEAVKAIKWTGKLFPEHFSCYQSYESLIDLSHHTLKACLIKMTDSLGTNIVFLEKLPPTRRTLTRKLDFVSQLKRGNQNECVGRL